MALQQYAGLSLAEIEKLMLYIPLFRQIQQYRQDQFDVLLASSSAQTLSPNTKLLTAGEHNRNCYFLLRGELEVCMHQSQSSASLGQIRAGEIFGELSLLLNEPRSADVLVPTHCRQAMVLTLDYRLFEPGEGFSLLDSASRRIFFQHISHHLRFKLDNLRQQHPDHPLANQHRQIPLRLLNSNPVEQLEAIRAQTQAMAKLLTQWNPSLQRLA